MRVRPDLLRARAHEREDPRAGLADRLVEPADGVLRERDAGVELGEEALLVPLLELVVVDAGVADAQDRDRVESLRLLRRVELPQLVEDRAEQAVAERGVRPVAEVDLRLLRGGVYDGRLTPALAASDEIDVFVAAQDLLGVLPSEDVA